MTGETHAADRRPEELGLVRRRARDNAAVGDAQHQRCHMGAERSFDVMVLSMNIRCHHAAQGDELGARRDRRKPTSGKENTIQLVER